jgi:hypothetical protein
VRLWRRRSAARDAPRAPGPELRLERERYGPGETVRGVVALDRGAPSEVEVSLNFHERSAEYDATPISLPSQSGEHGTDEYRFAIELPDDAPPALEGRHGELWWTVDARIGGSDSARVVSRRVEVRAAAPTGPGSAAAEAPEVAPPPRG